MQKLSKINARCVGEILPHIQEQVAHVEKLRNAGPDARLRWTYIFRQEIRILLKFLFILQTFSAAVRRSCPTMSPLKLANSCAIHFSLYFTFPFLWPSILFFLIWITTIKNLLNRSFVRQKWKSISFSFSFQITMNNNGCLYDVVPNTLWQPTVSHLVWYAAKRNCVRCSSVCYTCICVICI